MSIETYQVHNLYAKEVEKTWQRSIGSSWGLTIIREDPGQSAYLCASFKQNPRFSPKLEYQYLPYRKDLILTNGFQMVLILQRYRHAFG